MSVAVPAASPASGDAGGGAAAPPVPRPAGPPGRRWRIGPAAVFILPAVVILGGLVVYPTCYTVVRSFYDVSGNRFVGTDNYRRMFTDPLTRTSLENNAVWVVLAPILVTALGLIFAVLTERVRWATAFKLVVFMPMAISFTAAGVIFTSVYDANPNQGVLNAVLVGVHDLVSPGNAYPNAHPRPSGPNGSLATTADGFATTQTFGPGQAASLPLVGVRADTLPGGAAQARAASPEPGHLRGTVWLDFTPGNSGVIGQVDPGERGMPGLTVQALRGGSVAASTQTGPDGTFDLGTLPAGSYTLRLPASDFTQPYTGVTWLGSKPIESVGPSWLTGWEPQWLRNLGPNLVTGSIIGAYIWIWAGFAMVLIQAGLSSIPRETLEAARVDGATEWQVFRRVTMPQLAPVLAVVMVTLVINVLKVFDLVYIIAPGSTQANATVLALRMWQVSFSGQPDQGLGSAISVLLFVLVLPAMAFNVHRIRKERR